MKTTIQIFAIILLHICSYAQSIDIYRSGSIIKTFHGTTLTFNTAVDSALSGDSIVLSPHKFIDRRIKIDKNLIIQGTQTATDSTIIEQASRSSVFYIFSKVLTGAATKVKFRDIIVQDATLICSAGSNPRLDSLYGAGIKAFENTEVTITGNSIFRQCGIDIRCLPLYYIIDTNLYGGNAIYTRGKLYLLGNTKFLNNYCYGLYGGAVLSTNELVVSDRVYFFNNYSGAGGAIAATGIVKLKNKTKIDSNLSIRKGGSGIFIKNGSLELEDSVQITRNNSSNLMGDSLGGAICSYFSSIKMNHMSVIANNYGRGIAMLLSSLTIKDSAIIAYNLSNLNYGAGIYNKGGNITINGGQIIGNYYYYDSLPGNGMAIYNDTILGLPSPTLNIANARIFNPTQDFKRTIEVYNEAGTNLYSDSTWWGESDTTNLIKNNGTATTTLGSWIVADWSINKGIPIGKDTTFPIDAYFKLNSGAAIPPKMFWMLKGLYVCDYGIFNPDTADMLGSNYISTQYTASDTTRLVNLLATVDADSFKNSQTITGLSIEKKIVNKQFAEYNIYPNPTSEFLQIRSTNKNEKCEISIVDLQGKIQFQKKVSFNENDLKLNLSLVNGNYILAITNQSNTTKYLKFLVHKK